MGWQMGDGIWAVIWVVVETSDSIFHEETSFSSNICSEVLKAINYYVRRIHEAVLMKHFDSFAILLWSPLNLCILGLKKTP